MVHQTIPTPCFVLSLQLCSKTLQEYRQSPSLYLFWFPTSSQFTPLTVVLLSLPSRMHTCPLLIYDTSIRSLISMERRHVCRKVPEYMISGYTPLHREQFCSVCVQRYTPPFTPTQNIYIHQNIKWHIKT